jgi:hypothetical protein
VSEDCAGEGSRRPIDADAAEAQWRKSSWSAQNGNCLEFAEFPGGIVGVRDSKDKAPDRAILTFSKTEWESFVAGVVAGEFDQGNGGSRP